MTSPDKTSITPHNKSTPAEAEAYADPERAIRRVIAAAADGVPANDYDADVAMHAIKAITVQTLMQAGLDYDTAWDQINRHGDAEVWIDDDGKLKVHIDYDPTASS